MPEDSDPFDLQRFLDAQVEVMDGVSSELRAGRKSSHWMWFVFPQFAGLGFSKTADFYAIRSLAEAQAYLAHEILGARLRECAGAVNAIQGRSLHEIFGDPDELKFRSSMTLFSCAAKGATVFSEALRKYCDGAGDPTTLALLDRAKSG